MSIKNTDEGNERFGIYLPFYFPDRSPLELKKDSETIQIDQVNFSVKKKNIGYFIFGGEFKSENEAQIFLKKIKSCFRWYSLKQKTGVKFPEEIADINEYDEALKLDKNTPLQKMYRKKGWTKLHGDYDANKAYIIPLHLCLTRWETGEVKVSGGRGVENLNSLFNKAFEKERLKEIENYPKLKLGIDLYCSSQFKDSIEAEFLALFNSLEVLLEDTKVSQTLRKAIKLAEEAIDNFKEDQKVKNNKHQLDSLISRVKNLVNNSIHHKLKNQIAKNGESLITEIKVKNSIKNVYSTRNKLVHQGRIKKKQLKEGLEFLRKFVPLYLEKEFEQIVNSKK